MIGFEKGIFLKSLPRIELRSINLSLQWEEVEADLLIDENGCRIVSKKSNYCEWLRETWVSLIFR